MVSISNVKNKYLAADETVYGETPGTFTSVNLGQIQTVTVSEEENLEKLGSINGGHTYNTFEDGLYLANVSIETRPTKASLPILLEMCLGTRADSTDYTITSSDELNSKSIKVGWTADKILLINGFTIKDFSINMNKGDIVSFTLNGLAKKVSQVTETITATPNTETIFKDLDLSATVGGNAVVLNSLTLNGSWNVSDDEGRGIESVAAPDRRLITTVIKHAFDVNGSYEAEVDNNLEAGYVAERSNEAIVITMSRGTDNEHVFTLSSTRGSSRELGLSQDNSKRVMSYDFEALDLGITGDL